MWVLFSSINRDMDRLLEPHSSEWVRALQVFSPQQASYTAQVIKLMGLVCSICRTEQFGDYQISGHEFLPGVPATVRLCDHCKGLHEKGADSVFLPFSEMLNGHEKQPMC